MANVRGSPVHCGSIASRTTYALGINEVTDSEPLASFDDALAMAAPKPDPPVMIVTLCSQVSRVSTRPYCRLDRNSDEATRPDKPIVEKQQLVGSIWGGAG